MIHIGSSLGKVLSQGFETKSGRGTGLFKRFRNMYDRRNFIRWGQRATTHRKYAGPLLPLGRRS